MAAFSTSASASSEVSYGLQQANLLHDIVLQPVSGGRLLTDQPNITSQDLWSEKPALIYVDASLDQEYNVVGIIKEVAPVKGAETDAQLGVGEFQSKYFEGFPLYMDAAKKFYAHLGNKSLLSQSLPSWNPFKLYSDYKSLTKRVKDKGIEGNLNGEGLLKGGLLIITKEQGIVYQHNEETGFCMPYDDVIAVLQQFKPQGKPSST
eukprot:gene24965-30161_t